MFFLLYRQKDIDKIIDFYSPKSNCDGSARHSILDELKQRTQKMSTREQKAAFTGDEAGVGALIEFISAFFFHKINK